MENTGQSSLENNQKKEKWKEKDDPAKFLRPSQSDSERLRELILAQCRLVESQSSLGRAEKMLAAAKESWEKTHESLTAAKARRREARHEHQSDIRDESGWAKEKDYADQMLKAAKKARDKAFEQRGAAAEGKDLAAQYNRSAKQDALLTPQDQAYLYPYLGIILDESR